MYIRREMSKYGKVILLGIISIVAGIFAGPIFLAFGIITTIIALVVVAVGSRKKQPKIVVVKNEQVGFSRKTKVTLGIVLTISIIGFIGMLAGALDFGILVGVTFMIAFIVHYRQEKKKLRVVTTSIKSPVVNRGAV
jgi:hypothetical protein